MPRGWLRLPQGLQVCRHPQEALRERTEEGEPGSHCNPILLINFHGHKVGTSLNKV